MQNVTTNKQIYLSGGGDEKQSFPLDDFFIHTFPENGRLLYIPVALRGHTLYPTAHLWMEGVLKLHKRSDIQIDMADDLSRYKFEDLTRINGVYIGGGNTWSLMQEFFTTGFHNTLTLYSNAGGCVYGGSAGAIALGKSIDTHDDENTVELKDVSGLDLLHGYSVACHFKEDQGERFKTWATDNKLPIICLPEETGIIVEDLVARCVGTKPYTIWFANGTKSDVNPDESYRL
ncbi:MAG: Type 1 glutamine amidotransferase-like domain-containing protein [Candidatus Pacebacteria bacterium]|nr:Type 1 glutamine amidotransferase-like domain-containing protein [Candidatus Paceibacterota bacterium]